MKQSLPNVPSLAELATKIEKLPIREIACKSDLKFANILSERVGIDIYLKREDTQKVFSFKCRGAYAKLSSLSEQQRKKGVICASAGNHAQGLALSAQKLGVKATIVMPVITPEIKVEAVKRLGAKVILHGDIYDQAYEYACKLQAKHSYTFIHPYDDWDVIAGQGTIAKEILEQSNHDLDAIFVPVGGGGLIAGILAYIKHKNPNIKIIAVEPENSACLSAAIKAQKRVVLDHVGIFADGVAVKQIGQRPWTLLQSHLDDYITVDTDEICAAIKDIYEETRSMVEPSGALSVAGIKKYCAVKKPSFKRVVGINCGANLNFDRLRHISERAEIGEQREALFAIKIPEKPGSFKQFVSVIGKRNITEFNYRYAHHQQAVIFVGISLSKNPHDKQEFIQKISSHGYELNDLSQNEVAKLHLRYMIGGKAQLNHPETFYRFQFPEVPGALANFLNHLGKDWHISAFHYRNHGAAFGRVLAGFSIPSGQQKAFRQYLSQLNYFHVDETNNIVFDLFL